MPVAAASAVHLSYHPRAGRLAVWRWDGGPWGRELAAVGPGDHTLEVGVPEQVSYVVGVTASPVDGGLRLHLTHAGATIAEQVVPAGRTLAVRHGSGTRATFEVLGGP